MNEIMFSKNVVTSTLIMDLVYSFRESVIRYDLFHDVFTLNDLPESQ